MINMQHRLFVWNCRGVASTSFYRFCKQYVNSHHPEMIVIVEMRCEPAKLRKTCQLLGFNGFIASDVNGYSGGIVLAWKEDFFSVDLHIKKFQFLHLKVRNANGKEWFFTPVYASPNEENRRIMWEDLKRIAQNNSQPWMLAGDFNDIACAAEKKRRGNS